MKIIVIFLLNFLWAAELEHQTDHSSSSSEIVVYSTVSDLLTALTKKQQKELRRQGRIAEENACCAPAKSCHIFCCTEWKIVTRLFWSVTSKATWTITALTDYARRTLIPLAALGQFDTTTRDTFLTWIGILQIASETCEAICDFSSQRMTLREKDLTQRYQRKKQEKEYARLKALQRCVNRTIPNLALEQSALTALDAKRLRALYEPQSKRLQSIEDNLVTAMELTGCEHGFSKASGFFWTKSQPVFWVFGIGLAMAQMLVIATDLVAPEDTISLAILILTIEVLQYFSKRMKHIGMDEEYQQSKFRKKYVSPEEV